MLVTKDRGWCIYLFHHFQTRTISSSKEAFQLLAHCTPADRKGQRGHVTARGEEGFQEHCGRHVKPNYKGMAVK